MALKKRSQVLAFFEVLSSTINRMTGFTSLSKSMNPKEYTRQYIDMEGEITDVIGYSPSLDFAFDCDTTNAVHTDLASISDDSKTGSDAERYIYSVDLTKVSGAGFVARKRKYSVIPDAEGDSMDAYTYSGSFKAKDSDIVGVAVLNADKTQITTFTPNAGAKYLVSFNISDLSGQVAGASILINGNVLTTDSNGLAEIYLPTATYPAVISKALYTTQTVSTVVGTSAVYKAVKLVLA